MLSANGLLATALLSRTSYSHFASFIYLKTSHRFTSSSFDRLLSVSIHQWPFSDESCLWYVLSLICLYALHRPAVFAVLLHCSICSHTLSQCRLFPCPSSVLSSSQHCLSSAFLPWALSVDQYSPTTHSSVLEKWQHMRSLGWNWIRMILVPSYFVSTQTIDQVVSRTLSSSGDSVGLASSPCLYTHSAVMF